MGHSNPRRQPRLIVITGGPGSGKTTLVNALAAKGYRTVPEAAIQVIEALNAELGVEGQKAYRRDHLDEFQDRVLTLQETLERGARSEAHPGELVFLDRGRLDGLAYCRFFEQKPPKRLLTSVRTLKYERVFLLATLSRFEVRADTGRTSDRERSRALAETLRAVYREYGFEPFHVPQVSETIRAKVVLDACD